jgi:hypothetical protein
MVRPRTPEKSPGEQALAALLLGDLIFLSILGWIVVAAITGNL